LRASKKGEKKRGENDESRDHPHEKYRNVSMEGEEWKKQDRNSAMAIGRVGIEA